MTLGSNTEDCKMHPTVQLSARATPDVMIRNGGGRHAAESADVITGMRNLARSQAWRARHPGYWRKSRHPRSAPKDVSMTQVIGSVDKTGIFMRSPLQDLLTAQPAVLIGLIAHLVGTPQQDDIVRTTDRLLRLGQDILAMFEGPAAAPPS